MNKEEILHWLDHVYHCNGSVVDIIDDGKLFNHSDDPNSYSAPTGDDLNSYAIKEIKIGDEICEDYGAFEWPDWFKDLCYEFGATMDYF